VKLKTELSAELGTVGEELTSGTVDGPLSKYRKPREEVTATPTGWRDRECTVTTTELREM